MDLILVRHGECGTNSTDDILTSVGEWQAQQFGQRLTNMPVTALLSSPLLRALGTAHIIAHHLGNCPVEVWQSFGKGLMVYIEDMEVRNYSSAFHLQFCLLLLNQMVGTMEVIRKKACLNVADRSSTPYLNVLGLMIPSLR
jgi:hypothetical protein